MTFPRFIHKDMVPCNRRIYVGTTKKKESQEEAESHSSLLKSLETQRQDFMRPLGVSTIFKTAGKKVPIQQTTREIQLSKMQNEVCMCLFARALARVCVNLHVCVCVCYLGTVRVTSGTRLKLADPELFLFGI